MKPFIENPVEKMKEKVPIDEIMELIKKDYDEKRFEIGIKRQIMVQENKEPDYLPIFLYGKVPEISKFSSYDRRQQFYDPEKMFFIPFLWGCLSIIHGNGDNIPCIRINFGTGFLVSIFWP